MKKTSRIVSLCLSVMLLLSCVALPSLASDNPSKEGTIPVSLDSTTAAAVDELFETYDVYFVTDRTAAETDSVYYKEYPSVEAFQADIEEIELALAGKGKMPLPAESSTARGSLYSNSARANRSYLSLDLRTYYGGLYTLGGQWEYNWHFVNGQKEVTEFIGADARINGLDLFLTSDLKVWLGYPISDFWYEGDQPYYAIADSSTDYYVQWGCDLLIEGKIPGVDLPIGYSWYDWGYDHDQIPEY